VPQPVWLSFTQPHKPSPVEQMPVQHCESPEHGDRSGVHVGGGGGGGGGALSGVVVPASDAGGGGGGVDDELKSQKVALHADAHVVHAHAAHVVHSSIVFCDAALPQPETQPALMFEQLLTQVLRLVHAVSFVQTVVLPLHSFADDCARHD
jgi:hypothetical protein